MDAFVTDRSFEEFCKKHGEELKACLIDAATAKWLVTECGAATFLERFVGVPIGPASLPTKLRRFRGVGMKSAVHVTANHWSGTLTARFRGRSALAAVGRSNGMGDTPHSSLFLVFEWHDAAISRHCSRHSRSNLRSSLA